MVSFDSNAFVYATDDTQCEDDAGRDLIGLQTGNKRRIVTKCAMKLQNEPNSQLKFEAVVTSLWQSAHEIAVAIHRPAAAEQWPHGYSGRAFGPSGCFRVS